jgi:hypothetical protein
LTLGTVNFLFSFFLKAESRKVFMKAENIAHP